jgi:putative transposase
MRISLEGMQEREILKSKSTFKKLSHTLYECKYHIVFCPKYRFRILEGEIAEYSRREFYRLVKQKELVEVIELNMQAEHVHVILSIPPKYAVSSIMGFLKGRLALSLFRRYERIGKRFWGRHLWSRGYCVSTIGLNEDQIRRYVQWQEKQEKEAEQLGLQFEDA